MVEDSKFICPLYPPVMITQTYAEHLEYAAAHPEISYNGGIDLYADNKDVRAAFAGRIDKVAYQANGYGNYVKIRHAWGFSLYAHLSRIGVNVGDDVEAGSFIGIMGSTGFSTGTHLHFELRDLKENPVDPTALFTEQAQHLNAHSPLTAIAAEMGGNLRRTPLGDYIATIPYGTVGKVIDGPVYKNGLPCYQVEFPVTGWMAEFDGFGTMILDSIEEEK